MAEVEKDDSSELSLLLTNTGMVSCDNITNMMANAADNNKSSMVLRSNFIEAYFKEPCRLKQ